MIDEQLLNLYKASNNFGKLLDMDLEIIKKGEVQYQLHIQEKHLATPIAAHGGVVVALIDGTLGVAALSQVSHNHQVVSTVELKVNFLQPVVLGDVLHAEGKVIHAGKRLLYVEASVQNQKGTLVAKASGTFNAYPAAKAFKDYKSK